MTMPRGMGRWLMAGLAVAASVTLLILSGQRLTAGGQSEASGAQRFAPTSQQETECLAGGEARRVLSSRTGLLRFVGTEPGRPIFQPRQLSASASPEQAARSYLTVCGALFGLSAQGAQLEVAGVTTAGEIPRSIVRFRQVHRGIPVVGGDLIVHLNRARDVVTIAGHTLPATDLDTKPAVDSAAAIKTAVGVVARTYGMNADALVATAPELWIYNPMMIGPDPGPTTLVWRMDVATRDLFPVRELVLIDAQRGLVALHFNQIDTALFRQTYTAGNTTALPGTLVCAESNPSCSTGDAHAVAAHLNGADTYNFYLTNHGRDSIDNHGLTIKQTVHYSSGYSNAFWNGAQMVYGDAAGFPLADDVVGHELTHGVTQYTSKLFYFYQSGAINESLSDVWGEFIDQTNGRGTDTPAVKWLMGEDVTGLGAIRSMSNPPTYSQPDKMTSSFYYKGQGDNGGVHTNSGINNKAAFLMVDGGTFNGQTIASLGITKVAKIYYEVQTHLLTSGSDYGDLYDALYQGCNNLVGTAGITSADCLEVRKATAAVEMNQQPATNFDPNAPLCSAGQTPTNVFFDGLENGSGNFTFGALTGSTRWRLDSPYGAFAHTGLHFLYADDFPDAVSDTYVAMNNSVLIPSGAYLHFAHAFGFDGPYYDGGVVEYSTNGGATWSDGGPLFDTNGHRGAISNLFGNPLGGRQAFIDDSHGYISSRMNLSSLAGQSVRFRWRMGLDVGFFYWGWWLDDVRVYTCSMGDPPALTVSTTTVPLRGPVQVTFANGSEQKGEWIGLFAASTTGSGGYADWQWTSGGQGTSAGVPYGTLTFPTGGKTLTPGHYVFRWISPANTVLAQSAVMNVEDINPTPAITTINPSSISAGTAGFLLLVNGTGFVSGAVVQVDGEARTTAFNHGSLLSATLLASDATTAGTSHTITVVNPASCVDGVCTSNGATLNVTPPPAAPTLTSVSPTSVMAGGPSFLLSVTGTNFAGNSVVQVNGTARGTTFGSSTSLSAQVLASDITSGGTLNIAVFTPAPGGGTSSSLPLTVIGPGLTVSATTAPLAGPAQLTFNNGPGKVGEWIALFPVSTTGTAGYVDWQWTTGGQVGSGAKTSGTLTFPTGGRTVPAGAYVYRWISATNTVLAQSAVVNFMVINPTPTITSFRPSSVAAGSAGFLVVVEGTGFVDGAVVQIDGAARTGGVAAPTAAFATLLASDVATIGTHMITVVNPAACVDGVCSSNGVTLNVTPPPPAPTLTSIAPSSVTAGGPMFPVSVTGTNFAPNSVVQINGSARSTTFLSAAGLQATVLASDITSGGSLNITVFTPGPGGGTSGNLPMTVVGPTLTVNATTVPVEGPVQVTFSNGPGKAGEWVALSPSSTTGTAGYVDWQWTTGGQGTPGASSSGTLTFPTGGRTIPPGSYVFRWFSSTSTFLSQSPVVNFQLLNPTPTIATTSPTGVAAGSAAFTIAVNGTGFVSGAVVQLGGSARPTTFVSATKLTSALPATDVTTAGTAHTITVVNPSACVGGVCTSNGATLNVTTPPAVPALTSINPTTVTAGGAAFTLTTTGTDFAGNSVVQVNGSPRVTTFVSATSLSTQVLASDIASGGTLNISVFTPAPGGGTSGNLPLTMVGPGLTVSAMTVPVAGPVQVTFANGPGQATEWIALYPAAMTGTLGYADWQWAAGGQGSPSARTSGTLTFPTGGRTLAPGPYVFKWISATNTILAQSPVVNFQVINSTPTIATINPGSIAAGSATFTLAVNGTGFVNGAVVQVDGGARPATFVSATKLTAEVPASDVTTAGTAHTITVVNPSACVGGVCTSNGATLNVTTPPAVPALTSINPTTVTAGGAAFTLTTTGTDFAGNSVVQVNGSPRVTTFVSATSLSTQVLASDIASGGTLTITVFTPSPGGGTSNGATLTVVGPGLTVSATTVPVAGPVQVTFNNGPGVAGEWIALFPASTTGTLGYVDWQWSTGGQGGPGAATTGTLTFPTGGKTLTPGPYVFRWITGATILAQSPVVTFAVINPTPVITAITPSGIAAGSALFPLRVTGTGFISGATVQVDGSARPTTFSSSTLLTATLPASDAALQGTHTITVVNPSACLGGVCTSNGVTLTVTPPPNAPMITTINPTSKVAGGPGFPLTVTGTDFAPNSVLQVNGSSRVATVNSQTSLTGEIPASDIASGGTLTITVFTPAPGGGTSNSATLTVVGPGLTVSATTVPVAGPVQATFNNGPGAAGEWIALFPASTAGTTGYVDWQWSTGGQGGPGAATIGTLTFPTGGKTLTPGPYVFRWISGNTILAQSPVVTFAVINPTPTIATINLGSVAAGSAAFTLTVNGTGFVNGAVVQVDGSARPTTFVGATKLTAALSASDVTTAGTAHAITVVNPAACVGGVCTSNGATLNVTAPPSAPTLTSINPTTVAAGGPAFLLTVTGTNFAGNSMVQVNGNARTTTFGSATQLTATVLASDIASAGTPTIAVFTPTPGGGTSNGLPLTVAGPAITVDATSVTAGSQVTATLTNAPGGATDWFALALSGAPPTSYAAFVYVGTGLTTRTWTVTVPSTPGTYEFRFFPNNGFVKTATSPAITVTAPSPLALIYHGGPVQHAQKVYTIFWNPTGTPSLPSGYQSTLNQFVQDLNGSPYYAIASQYGDAISKISTAVSYGGTWLDTTNAIPHNPPTDADLISEVVRAKAANGWTSDANSYFQIYTPGGYGTTTSYCGYHDFSSANNFAYGIVLLPANHTGGTCFPGGTYPNGQIVDSAISTSAHEILEAVTDPRLNAWWNAFGDEIADICAWDFGSRAIDGSNVTFSGRKYLIQREWSNARSACVLSPLGPLSLADAVESALPQPRAVPAGGDDPAIVPDRGRRIAVLASQP